MVVSLAVIAGAGSSIGATIGSTLSVSYLADLGIFRPVFGVLVLLVAVQIIWILAYSPCPLTLVTLMPGTAESPSSVCSKHDSPPRPLSDACLAQS